VVRRIFDLAASGMGTRRIAHTRNADGTHAPGDGSTAANSWRERWVQPHSSRNPRAARSLRRGHGPASMRAIAVTVYLPLKRGPAARGLLRTATPRPHEPCRCRAPRAMSPTLTVGRARVRPRRVDAPGRRTANVGRARNVLLPQLHQGGVRFGARRRQHNGGQTPGLHPPSPTRDHEATVPWSDSRATKSVAEGEALSCASMMARVKYGRPPSHGFSACTMRTGHATSPHGTRPRRGLMSTSMKRPPVSSDRCVYGVPLLAPS
jgi:hypothetical protein